jgi:hypothetical protein
MEMRFTTRSGTQTVIRTGSGGGKVVTAVVTGILDFQSISIKIKMQHKNPAEENVNREFDGRGTKKLFSLRDTSVALGGISHWTLRKHVSAGRVRVVRIGRRVFLDAEEMDRIRREGLPSLRAVITSDAFRTANPNPQQEN